MITFTDSQEYNIKRAIHIPKKNRSLFPAMAQDEENYAEMYMFKRLWIQAKNRKRKQKHILK